MVDWKKIHRFLDSGFNCGVERIATASYHLGISTTIIAIQSQILLFVPICLKLGWKLQIFEKNNGNPWFYNTREEEKKKNLGVSQMGKLQFMRVRTWATTRQPEIVVFLRWSTFKKCRSMASETVWQWLGNIYSFLLPQKYSMLEQSSKAFKFESSF